MLAAKYTAVLISLALCCFEAAGASSEDVSRDEAIKALQNTDSKISQGEKEKKQGIRLQAVYDAGLSWAMQEGLYHRHQDIQKTLEKGKAHWYTIFDFSKFIYDSRILAPVMESSHNLFEKISNEQVREARASYTLKKPARIVFNPPTWRDYLFHPIKKPLEPNYLIMPRNDEEQEAWDKAVEKGFKMGEAQAERIFEIDMKKLKGDFLGMYLFQELVEMNMVSVPTISKELTPVLQTSDGRTLNINDTIYTINKHSKFKRARDWQPRFTQADIDGASDE